MSYLRGPDREQVQLLPPSVEDYVSPESTVRFIDAFVEGLDFAKLGFTRAQPANTRATALPSSGSLEALSLRLFATDSFESKFKYDSATDTYECPAGQQLKRHNQYEINGNIWVYYYSARACENCKLRSQCTPHKHRVIARRKNEEVVERTAKRVADKPQIIARRREIVEHVFGTLRQWTHDEFLMRGVEKVRAEFCLSCLVYNLKRVLNLMSLDELLKKVAPISPALAGAE